MARHLRSDAMGLDAPINSLTEYEKVSGEQ